MKIRFSKLTALAAISEKKHGSMRLHHPEMDGEAWKNRALFLREMQVPCQSKCDSDRSILELPDHMVPALAHGDVIECISKVTAPQTLRCDGLLTDKKKLPLTLTAADCPPVFFFDPFQRVIGLAHSGWRGVAANLPGKMIKRMQAEYNCDPRYIEVYIGPGIRECHFEIGPEVAEQLGVIGATGKMMFDLPGTIRADLLEAGVDKFKIVDSGECTYCQENKPRIVSIGGKREPVEITGSKYFSFRRDKPEVLQTMLAVICLL